MIITFQIILFLVLLITFIGAVGSKEKDERLNMASINVASIVALVVTFLWL